MDKKRMGVGRKEDVKSFALGESGRSKRHRMK